MDQLKKIASISLILVTIGCLKSREYSENVPSVIYEETIEMSNYNEVLFSGKYVKIGTPRYYYISGEVSYVLIKNLPIDCEFKIIIDGREVGSFTENGNWSYENKELISGVRRHSIEIINLISKEIIKEEIEYEVRELDPFVESEYGGYLIKEIPTDLAISNLGLTCPHVKLKAEGGTIVNIARGGYRITPCRESEKVIITMNYNGRIFKKEFKTINTPPPHISFLNVSGLKCIELKPIGLFSKLNYSIKCIKGYSFSANEEIQIDNSHCFRDNDKFFINEIIYSIDEIDYIDTLKFN